MYPITAVDAINPAIARTRALLFPFRFSLWWRLAFLALFTGEMSTGGANFNYHMPAGSSKQDFFAAAAPSLSRPEWMGAIAVIAIVVLIALGLMVLFAYIASVLRFVWFEGVLTGHVRIREGWRKWSPRAGSLFGFFIALQFATFAAIAVVVLPAVLKLVHTDHPTMRQIFLAIAPAAGLAMLIVLASTVVFVLVKDFCVPIMALEGTTVLEAWRKLGDITRGTRGSYAAYVLLKAVLAVAAGIAIAIVAALVILVLAIPVIIAVAVGATAGLTWNAVTITLLIVGIMVGIVLMVLLGILLGTPQAVFFQSYALQFFGSRYDRLAAYVYPVPVPPAPAPAPQTPPPPAPPQAPPEAPPFPA